ncbi:MAG TPA: hypothetical protein VEA37_02600, partial [Flavobacterium sp.]|nr:hypothetical protein [Flavobacterium sp.]
VSTWGPLYRQLVDSILNMGSRVIVQRIIPAANNTPTIVNTFVDTTWSNHPKVQILNLHNTTPLWKDTTFNIDLRYYDAQGVHPNEDGGELMYWYTKSQLEKFLKPQMTSMSDANMIGIRNKQMYVFDSSGYKIGAWKPYRMVGFTFNDSDSTVTPSGGGSSGDVTGPGSSTDNAAAVFNGATGKIIKNSTIIISPTGAITGIASMATSNVSLTPYNSGGVLDALKIINNNLGAVLGVQNNNGGGFSGIEYIGNDGLVKVFTGFANGITGQFRFNNIASSGNFVWMIASNSALAINNQRESLFDGLPDQGAFAVQAATGIFTSSLRINGPFNLNGFNGSAGQVLTSNGSSVPTWTSLAITTSGNTVPTGTAGTNVDAVTPYKVHWIRTNDEVSFSGTVDIDATVGSGSAVIELSLPGGLISDFAATTDASGVVSQGTAPNGTSGWVNASVANNRLVLTVTAVSTSAATYYFTGHFSIILP